METQALIFLNTQNTSYNGDSDSILLFIYKGDFMEKITKVILTTALVCDFVYGHTFPIMRRLCPDGYAYYFKLKDELYDKLGIPDNRKERLKEESK